MLSRPYSLGRSGPSLPLPQWTSSLSIVGGEKTGAVRESSRSYVAQATQILSRYAVPLQHGCGWQVPREGSR